MVRKIKVQIITLGISTMMLVCIPMINVNATGKYTTNSSAITANLKVKRQNNLKEAAFPAVIGVVVGVVAVAGFVMGVVEGWNSVHEQVSMLPSNTQGLAKEYNSNDFSQFDI